MQRIELNWLPIIELNQVLQNMPLWTAMHYKE